MLDKKKIKAELKDFSEDAAEAIGEALKENFVKCCKAAWAGFSVLQKLYVVGIFMAYSYLLWWL
jgi:hypothetical protein|tara:strand:+ start:172 stop:363 length:192 start_codon:yes stop_codon:yes gene_type:complete